MIAGCLPAPSGSARYALTVSSPLLKLTVSVFGAPARSASPNARIPNASMGRKTLRFMSVSSKGKGSETLAHPGARNHRQFIDRLSWPVSAVRPTKLARHRYVFSHPRSSTLSARRRLDRPDTYAAPKASRLPDSSPSHTFRTLLYLCPPAV